MSTRPSHPSPRPRARRRALLGLLLLPGILVPATFHPADSFRALARTRVALDGGRSFSAGRLSLQEGPWDCGPTALHNLLLSLGVPTPGPEELARMSGTGRGGTSLGGLVRAARSLGARLRARRIATSDLRSVGPPYLAWYREGHFVTVLGMEPDGELRIHDPGVGGYRLPMREFRRRWGGVVADLAPDPAHRLSREPRGGPDPRSPSDRRSP